MIMAAMEGGVLDNLLLIEYDKYSSLSRYINVMVGVISAGRKFGCCYDDYMLEVLGTTDPYVAAKLYFVKQVQTDLFSKELEFLSNPRDSKVPDLVSNLISF